MYKWKTKRVTLIVLLSLMMSALFLVSGAAAENSAPIYLSFEKTDPEGDFVWNGTVDGDVSGGLETQLLGFRQSSKILHVEFDWIVEAGNQSFTARLYGILDTETGRVVMDGTIIDGWLEGAQVHEEGQLVDLNTSAFEGTIRIMPASAD
ncbi:MAG: hypothetical protein PVH03_02485 [Chloroflexota bacterium]|jgi:hypothetical protein